MLPMLMAENGGGAGGAWLQAHTTNNMGQFPITVLT